MARLKMDIELALGEFRLAVTQSLELEGSTALFGPSGSGKTSLLRIIAGLETQARGRMVSGQDTWQDSKTGAWVPPHRRELGMVFQDARLFTHLSVAGNLRYADRRARSTEIDISFSEVVAAMDLSPLLDRKVDGLSGGERQRVAIGRTLLRRPRLLLMDEPLAALDRQRKAELMPYIEALPARFGIPILYVTHALEEVGRLADRMLVMSEGRVLTTGRTAEVMESLDLLPLTGQFEAGVLLEGRVLGQDPTYALTSVEVAGQTLVVPALDLPDGSAVRLRVRARDVALAKEKPHGLSIRNILSARVLDVAAQPDTAFAEVLLDLDGVHLRARITRASVSELGLKPGDALYALVKSIAVDRSLFSVET
jgi:molybdate transport system ATP-binding protein